jgi:hypothetical protein
MEENCVDISKLIFILAMLSQLKIPSLEAQKKEAKQGYQEYLQAYVTSYLGRPMEKVHVSAKIFLFVFSCDLILLYRYVIKGEKASASRRIH